MDSNPQEGQQAQQQQPSGPQLPEGLDQNLFQEGLKAYGIERPEEVAELREKASSFEKKAQEYEQQMKARSPLATRIEKMITEGRGTDDVAAFLKLQSLDPSQMSDEDAVRYKMSSDYPSLSVEEIEAQIEDLFGPESEDAKAKAKRSAQLKIKGKEAKEWLALQQEETGKESKMAEEARAQKQKLSQAWQGIAPKIATEEAKLKFAENSDKVGGDYSFEYSPKLTEEQTKMVEKAVMDYAVQNNLTVDDAGWEEASRFRDNLLWNINREDFLKHMAMDMYASVKEAMVRKKSGYTPPAPAQRAAEPKKPATQVRRPGYL